MTTVSKTLMTSDPWNAIVVMERKHTIRVTRSGDRRQRVNSERRKLRCG